MKETSARPSWPTSCTTMSIGILRSAILVKIRLITPGRSGMSHRLTRASLRTSATPVTTGASSSPGGAIKRSGAFGIRRPHAERHAILLGEFDRPRVHHAGAQAGQLEHLVVGDPVDLAGLRDEPRIGGEDTFDVGVDLALVGPAARPPGPWPSCRCRRGPAW